MITELHWIEGPWPGRLAITPRPRGGDWLADELQSWRQSGVDGIVSLLESGEIADLSLQDEPELCRANGMQFYSFAIADRGIPSSRVAFTDLLTQLAAQLAEGKNLAVHCRQGVGRAALVAASLLVLSGMESKEALRRVGAARGCSVPETSEQRLWIEGFATSLTTAIPK
jgi:protein-tyrosine phosphatase